MIAFDGEALADLERIFEFNFERDPATPLDHIRGIREAVSILDRHPAIGRPVAGSPSRELVISYGRTGYVALHEHSPALKLVRVTAIRHQREAGYRGTS